MKALLLISGIFISFLSFGQKNQRVLLSDYIPRLQEKYKITFSYDPESIKDIKIVEVSSGSVKETLKHLDSLTAFNFQIIDEENILVSPKKAEKNILISGKIKDDSGFSMNGALVYIKKQEIAVTANEKGEFRLLASFQPTDTVTISFTGYKSQHYLLSSFNENGSMKIEMQEAILSLDEMVITAYLVSGVNYRKDNQSIIINPSNSGLIPGETESDIYNTLRALPGINSPDDKAGNLTLRGSDPDKILITYDNIPIYHKGHYFGTFSPFNVQAIDEITVQRNGMTGSDKGGRVSGMINIKSKDNIPDSTTYFTAAATSYFQANVSVPIANKKVGLFLGGRSSYPFKWNSPKINSINDFIFQESTVGASLSGAPGFTLYSINSRFFDANAKLVIEANKKHKQSISYLHIRDDFTADYFNSRMNLIFYDTVKLNNWGVDLTFTDQWTDKITTITSITKSFYLQYFTDVRKDADSLILAREESFKNITDNLKLNSTTTFELKKEQCIIAGYEMDYTDLFYESTLQESPDPIGIIGSEDKEFVHSLFFNYNFLGVNKLLNFTAGIRSSYYTGTEQFYFEPRIMVNLLLSKSFTLKASSGYFNQYINQVASTHVSTIGGVDNFNIRLSNKNTIPVVQGIQGMFGGIFSKNNLVIDVEGYVKKVDNSASYNFLNGTGGIIYGGYDTYGVDVLIKKSYKKFEGWLSYSFSSSIAQFDTTSFEYVWNQPHIINLVLSYRWKNFKFAVGGKYRSGMAALPSIRTKFFYGGITIPGYQPPPPGPPSPPVFVDGPYQYLDRFPDNFQMDVSVSYKYEPKRKNWVLNIGGSIQNVFDNPILFDQIPRPLFNQGPNTFLLVNKYGLGFTPSLQISFAW